MLKYTRGIKQVYVRVGVNKINIPVEGGSTFDEAVLGDEIVERLLSTGDFEQVINQAVAAAEQKVETKSEKKSKKQDQPGGNES